MSHDPKQKTNRSFECRDYLWEIFEDLAKQLGCSTDFLLNEAMRLYARTRADENEKAKQILGLPWNPVSKEQVSGSVTEDSTTYREANQEESELESKTAERGIETKEATSNKKDKSSEDVSAKSSEVEAKDVNLPSTNPPEKAATVEVREEPTGESPNDQSPDKELPNEKSIAESPSSPPGATIPPPLPGGSNEKHGEKPTGKLYLHFEDQKALVDKDEFIIGRSARNADFAIRDANISRRHAAVVLENGVYKIKDLGSTNGVEFEGKRVGEKAIENGDSYKLCNFVISFSTE